MKILIDRVGTKWIEITREEYELNINSLDYVFVIDQDTNIGGYFKKYFSIVPEEWTIEEILRREG